MTAPRWVVAPGVTRYKGRFIDDFEPVRVYRNLHRGGYSVMQHGLVVGHARQLMLQDCVMIVQEAGARRAKREGRKNVHAFIQGEIVESGMGLSWDDPRALPMRFRYCLGEGFMTEAGNRVKGAMTVKLDSKGASAAYAHLDW